eukprot:COSAG04_NODE_10636_length_762_cov_1.247360_1_plen_162_part_00
MRASSSWVIACLLFFFVVWHADEDRTNISRITVNTCLPCKGPGCTGTQHNYHCSRAAATTNIIHATQQSLNVVRLSRVWLVVAADGGEEGRRDGQHLLGAHLHVRAERSGLAGIAGGAQGAVRPRPNPPKPPQVTLLSWCARVRRLLNAVHMAEIVGFQTI